jgi:hypothetical protein
MDTLYRILLAIHGLAGIVALVTFWAAAFAKKGSPSHRWVGKAYLIAMCGIVITAIPMAVVIGMRGKYGIATFFAYLVVITSTGMWQGWRAIRRKRDQAGFRDNAYIAVALLNLTASVVVFVVGLKVSEVLLMGFSAIGTITGLQMIIRRAKPMLAMRWWLEEHFAAMVGCGVATHIAFLAIGLDRSIRAVGIDPPRWYHLIAWFLPLSLSFVAVPWLRRKYIPKTGAGAAVMSKAGA